MAANQVLFGQLPHLQDNTDDFEEKLAQVNKSLNDSVISDDGYHPKHYEYGCASLNFLGDQTGLKNRELRKFLLGGIYQKLKSSIILCQECPWKNPTRELNLPDTYNYIGDPETKSGILWDEDDFEIQHLRSDVEIDKLDLADKFPNLMNYRTRATICKVILREKLEVEGCDNVLKTFIAISWHGPKNKLQDITKTLIFKELLEFCKNHLQRKYSGLPIILGGDFNYAFNKAEKIISTNYNGWVLPSLSNLSDSKSFSSIDYFLYLAPFSKCNNTEDIINPSDINFQLLTNVERLSLKFDAESLFDREDKEIARTKRCQKAPEKVIDHNPIIATLHLKEDRNYQ